MDENRDDIINETEEPLKEMGEPENAGDTGEKPEEPEDNAVENTTEAEEGTADAQGAAEEEESSGEAPVPFWTRNRKKIAAAAAGILLILLVLGAGIAFGISGSGDDKKDETTAATVALQQESSSDAADETVLQSSEEETTEKTTEKETTIKETTEKETTEKETTEKETTEKETTIAETTEEPTEETAEETPEITAAETQKPTETVPQTTKAAEKPTTEAVPVQPTATAAQPAAAESGTPYANHGKLTVSGTNILDQNGNIYQLRGVSTHGIGWYPDYVSQASFQTMRDEWGINVVRIAMYTAEYNGYCTGGDQAWLKNLVDTGVQAATNLGLYVIIDWHILSDGNPNTNKASSLAFFKEISAKYASYGNVLYEICNEPNGGVGWSEIKAYAQEVIPVIRANAKDSIIIVGTPTWSQDVDQAAANPITGQNNIMYALHFYAATHKDDLRNKMLNAIAAGLPIFVTEYGICDASGSGGIDEASANAWVSAMNQNHVSYCIWNLSNKNETSALINSSCSKTSGWTTSELSASGKWFVNMMKGNLDNLGTTSGGNSGTTGQTQAATQQQTQAATQTEYVAPTTQAPKQASSGNCSVQANNTNSWGDSTQGYHMQIDVAIQNTGSDTITGWKVVLKFSGNVEVESSWNGSITVSGSTVTITSDADWNKDIAPGGSLNPGLILKSSSEVKLTDCSIQ